MPESDWLNQNAHRFYPFEPSADFTTDAGTFDGKSAFSDAGFTLGIASAFEHAQDYVYLERYYMSADIIRFVFRLAYAPAAPYEAMLCYEWVFEFDTDASLGATVYAVPTRITEFDLIGEENPEMGLGFLSVGDLSVALVGAVDGNVYLTETPQVEPALLQSNVNTFVNQVKVANEERPCPPACDCESSSSGSSESSESSSSSSSESSSSGACEDPLPPEPAELTAPVRIELPDGTFVGDIKLKPGYNCIIDINELLNSATIRSRIDAGEGMQCEDLRIGPDGVPVHETCRDCSGMVYAVSGAGFGVEQLQLIGEQGVLVLPDADNHRIVIRFEEEGICEVDI